MKTYLKENKEEIKDMSKKDAINEKIKNIRAKIGLEKDASREQSRIMNGEGANDNEMTRTFAMDFNESFGGINNKGLGKDN